MPGTHEVFQALPEVAINDDEPASPRVDRHLWRSKIKNQNEVFQALPEVVINNDEPASSRVDRHLWRSKIENPNEVFQALPEVAMNDDEPVPSPLHQLPTRPTAQQEISPPRKVIVVNTNCLRVG